MRVAATPITSNCSLLRRMSLRPDGLRGLVRLSFKSRGRNLAVALPDSRMERSPTAAGGCSFEIGKRAGCGCRQPGTAAIGFTQKVESEGGKSGLQVRVVLTVIETLLSPTQ